MPRRTDRMGGPKRTAPGFTLLEAVIATALIGMGVVAMLVATQVSTQVNATGQEMTQACYWLEEVREYTLQQPFSTIWRLHGAQWSPPKRGDGTVAAGLTEWSQKISIDWKDPASVQTHVDDGTSDLIYVNVTISHRGKQVLTSGWLVAKKVGEP